MKKTALITGISGQDGAYLAQLLIKKNYRVIGTDRRSARFSNWRLRRLGIENEIIFEEMELSELYEVQRVFNKLTSGAQKVTNIDIFLKFSKIINIFL